MKIRIDRLKHNIRWKKIEIEYTLIDTYRSIKEWLSKNISM